jgi:hypothetical protein
MTERWLPVVGYEGLYEVSDQGRVQSLDRRQVLGAHSRFVPGRILRPQVVYDSKGRNPRSQFTLRKDGKSRTFRVHTLVLTAFVGPRPDGMLCRHWPDPDTSNNRLENLSWGTPAENMQDRLAHEVIRKTQKESRMPYEINWATGGRVVVEADSPEQANEMAQALLPPGGDWVDIDVLSITPV